ncbi:hypothetical protein FAZ69_10475 [Trinickia terrae]|uniref:Uncharacterized protein n=1 Tax=Trinickia terrae TaxID=2571161 RepID=A0A4U1I7Y5_9BURK|nr:hypothetical protein [Trinickia terrae]TKC89365.1 hypothetical protein FAZ69_10475 [Trinickia terrae]
MHDVQVYVFDRLRSRHEDETRTLERAIASTDQAMRAHLLEFWEAVEFRRMPNVKKLALALQYAAGRLISTEDDDVSLLSSPRNFRTIAAMLAEWLTMETKSMEQVLSAIRSATASSISDTDAANCVRRLGAFARGVVDARDYDDLMMAAGDLIDVAKLTGVSVLMDLLLKRVKPAADSGQDA